MPKEQYIYAVTRIHTHEQSLLSGADVEALIQADTPAEALRLLADKGWGEGAVATPEAMMAAEMHNTWALINELLGDAVSQFDVLRLASDYHNLKAAIKLAYTGADLKDAGRYLQPFGSQDTDKLLQAAQEHDFTDLPPAMAEAGREAYETLAQTGNGQACDMVLDRAALIAIDEAGKATDSELLRRYAQLQVDTANIKAAVRCARMQKPEEFIRRAVAPAGTLDAESLVAAATGGEQSILDYLRTTPYADAVDVLETGMAAFERWCQNRLVALIRPQRQNYFGIEPLAAFILARQNEIAAVRVILSAKINGFGETAVRERLRDMYV